MPKEYLECVDALIAEGTPKADAQRICAIAYDKKHGTTPAEAAKEGEMSEWFEIFKVGRHTDSAGNTREWTEEDLAHIAASYDPAHHEAPIVLGHPKDDAPAYGWVEALKAEAGKLFAKPKQVADALKDWVTQGAYKKVSLALYPDRSLRHIGFLGAQPPAVKGLAPATFADAGRAWTYLEPYQERTIKGLFARLRDWLIAEKGLETADTIITPWDLEALEAKPQPDRAPAYAEPGAAKPPTPPSGAGGAAMKDWLQKLQAALVALFAEAEKTLPANDQGGKAQAPTVTVYSESDVQAREAAAAEKATQAALAQAARATRARDVRARVAQFCETQKAAGKFLPAWQEQGLPAVLEQALLVEQPLQFAEGKDPKNPGEILLGIFGDIPKLVEFKEIASARTAAGDRAEDPEAIANRALEYVEAQKKLGKTIAVSQAVQHVMAGPAH